MFKKKKIQKENHMLYFFGGTAIGIAAGLLAGKLFTLNTSAEENEKFGSEILVNKNIKKNSQDDNTRNKYLTKKDCTISKSAAQYNGNDYTEKSLPSISSNTTDNELKYNTNNLNSKCKRDKDDGIFYNKNHTLFNISVEDNNKCNTSTNIFSENIEEKTKNNSYFKFEDIKRKSPCTQLENIVNIKDETLSKTTNEKRKLITESVDKDIGLADTFNNLSINFYEDSATYKNLPYIKNSEISSNISSNYIDNASNMATCNDTTYPDNEERNILNFTSMEEFCETGIISSTRYNNFDDI